MIYFQDQFFFISQFSLVLWVSRQIVALYVIKRRGWAHSLRLIRPRSARICTQIRGAKSISQCFPHCKYDCTETLVLSLTLLEYNTTINLQHPGYCLWSYLNRKHHSVHIHYALKFIRRGIPTTTAPNQHRNTAPKRHRQGVAGYLQLRGVVMCDLPTDVDQFTAI